MKQMNIGKLDCIGKQYTWEIFEVEDAFHVTESVGQVLNVSTHLPKEVFGLQRI